MKTVPKLQLPEPLLRPIEAGKGAWQNGDYEIAQRWFEQALDSAAEHQHTLAALYVRYLLGNVAEDSGDLIGARLCHEVVLSACRMLGYGPGLVAALESLALIAERLGDTVTAEMRRAEALNLRLKLDMPPAERAIGERHNLWAMS